MAPGFARVRCFSSWQGVGSMAYAHNIPRFDNAATAEMIVLWRMLEPSDRT